MKRWFRGLTGIRVLLLLTVELGSRLGPPGWWQLIRDSGTNITVATLQLETRRDAESHSGVFHTPEGLLNA